MDRITSQTRIFHIRPQKGWIGLNLRELWEYRDLLVFLCLRDIKVRYKQTVMGVSWAIIQPVLAMIVFTVIFGRLVKVDSNGIPYPIFSFAALLPWNLFSNGLTSASNSLVGNANLIKKVYFPRLVIPISSVLSNVVDFFLAFLVLLIMMFYYEVPLSWRMFLLPLFALLAVICSLGVGFWLSALNVQFRDVKYTLPFLTQLLMYASPVVWASTSLPEPWRQLSGLNPLAGVIEGFRWSLLGGNEAPGPMLFVSSIMAVLLFLTGAVYFKRMEKTFADVV